MSTPKTASAMQAFEDDEQLERFLAYRAAHRLMPPSDLMAGAAAGGPAMPLAVAAAPAGVAPSAVERTSASGITNTQETGVDEGGIVKMHGDHLVVLRRSRLFTIATGGRALRAIDRINAFPPGTTGRGAWYDEMLVAGDRVVVIGYSFERGGTEINRFHIDEAGRLRFEDSHHLRSADYYSGSNYASRLIGDRLVLYTPLPMNDGDRPLDSLPAMRRWTGDRGAAWERIASATRIHLPEPVRRDETADVGVLHTVTTCDLADERLSFAATAVLGGWSRSFYVSAEAVYVWIADGLDGTKDTSRAMLYRLPLDGGQPGAVRARGGPVDQFSFREDHDRQTLDVLVRADVGGDAMWRSEASAGELALLALPLTLFGDGSAEADANRYRSLPLAPGASWSFHNRFVGNHLLYAAGALAAERPATRLFAVPVAGGEVVGLDVPHGIDRIEVMGGDAVAVGNEAGGRLGFTAIGLDGSDASVLDTSFLAGANEGERRSHAFFYRPDPNAANGASGLLGLPVSRHLADSRLRRFLGSGSAIAFLRREQRHLVPAGELEARPAGPMKDGSELSGIDWYGNARPIFIEDRILALLGYELVEGRIEGGAISEVDRIDYLRPTTLH